MLQKIRDKTQNWISILIIGFLILMFGMWGISYYLSGSSSNQQSIVQINGQSVPLRKYQALYNYERQAASQAITNGTVSIPELKKLVLSSLIQDQLLYQGVLSAGLGISTQSLDSLISSMPVFQANGQFSQALYQSYLQNQGLDTQGLRDKLKQSVLTNQWRLGFSESNFILPHELDNYHNFLNQTRTVQLLLVPFESINNNQIAAPSEPELLAYYQAHQEDFRIPEQIKLDYLILNLQDLKNKNKLTDQAAQEQYADLGNQLANLTFENPQSLSPAASQLNLSIQHTDWLDKNNFKNNTNKIFSNPIVINSAFSSDVLSNGQNSDPINLSPSSVMVLRVSAHQPSKIQDFSDPAVKIQCLAGVIQEKKAALLKITADNLAKAGHLGSYQSLTASRTGFKQEVNNLNNKDQAALLNSIFKMRLSNNSNIQEIFLPHLGYALVNLVKINPAADLNSLNLKQARAMAQDLRSDLASLDYVEYLQGLQRGAKIITDPRAATLL